VTICAAPALDRPSAGTVTLGDTNLARLSERRLTVLRRERIGWVLQAFDRLPTVTVAQKIASQCSYYGPWPR
jgi:putative ABC transport system ATP-binding protein